MPKKRQPREDGHEFNWKTRTCQKCGLTFSTAVEKYGINCGDPEPAKPGRQHWNTRDDEALYCLTSYGRALAEEGFDYSQRRARVFARRYNLHLDEVLSQSNEALAECAAQWRPGGMPWLAYLRIALPRKLREWWRLRYKSHKEAVACATLMMGDQAEYLAVSRRDHEREADNAEAVQTILARLTQREADILRATYFENKTDAEAAESLGLPRGVFWRRRQGALAMARDIIGNPSSS